MPDRINVHQPLLVNTIGHCAGAAIFGILVYLFVLDWSRSRRQRSKLSAIAAALALVWNLGSLVALGHARPGFDPVMLLSFCVLSLLPAVLLHISVCDRYAWMCAAGYGVSLVAAGLHVWDEIANANAPHRWALLLITAGFGGLSMLALLLDLRNGKGRLSGSRLVGSMCLLLLVASYVHFDHGPGFQGWSGEFSLHHAGVPLALFVLLYDYRFLFLDAFLRFTVNGLLASVAVAIALILDRRLGLLAAAGANPFFAALLFAASCAFLAGFAHVRTLAQRVLTGAIFRRESLEPLEIALQELANRETDLRGFQEQSGRLIARFFRSELVAVRPGLPEHPSASGPFVPSRGAELALPVRLSSGECLWFLLGPRRGGRPFLSEDLEIAARLGKFVEVQIERRRQAELEKLASQAELRALQAQINPHFLFNALNTLYGTISRDNAEARRLVLNLSDVFRYFLRSERTFIPVAEELKIVRAYLEIEELRLGPKLQTSIVADDAALPVAIPVLSIQPLVENAVKHGVARRAEPGYVRIAIRIEAGSVRVAVVNSGEFGEVSEPGAGVGLANVRRRLNLCYGLSNELSIRSAEGTTEVSFSVPAGECA